MSKSVYSNKSYWLAHSGDYFPSQPLKGSISVDVAVIGAGFTGLSTAYNIRKEDSSTSVAVLEAECVAFGATGRTSGWVVPISLLDPMAAKLLYGKERLSELQDFAWEGLDFVKDLVAKEHMESDFEVPGATFTTLKGYEKKLERFSRFWSDQKRSSDGEYMDRATVSSALNSDAFCGGYRMPHSGQINPVKHARELKRIAIEAGAEVYEQTPVIDIKDEGSFILRTPEGEVRAKHLVLATNGYSHLLPPELGIKRAQYPMFVYQLITEPLKDEEWAELGWKRRGQFYDKSTYFPPTCRTTVDGRLQFNLCDIFIGKGRSMEEPQRTEFFTAAERLFASLFPAFRKFRIAQRWSGACSIPFDVKPQVGSLKGGRLSYALGYSGAGVMMSQNLGRILADLALQKNTRLTEKWWVAIEGNKKSSKLHTFPNVPGAEAAIRASVAYEIKTAKARRKRLELA